MQTKHLFLELQLLLTVEGKQKRYHFTNRSRNREYLSYILAGYESVLLDSTLVRIEDFQSERIGCCHLAFGPQKTRMLKYYQDHFEKSLSLIRQWSWQIHCRKPVTAFDIKVNGNFGGLPTPISYDKIPTKQMISKAWPLSRGRKPSAARRCVCESSKSFCQEILL